jgi:hypothetical protein
LWRREDGWRHFSAVIDCYGPGSSVGRHRGADTDCPLWSDLAGLSGQMCQQLALARNVATM